MPSTNEGDRPVALAERYAAGKALRERVPRRSHGEWAPARGRRPAVEQLLAGSADRAPELLAIRYGRMAQSPFAFFRGAAAIMAADLAGTPRTGFSVQACGDCHLLNFGGFATPERRLLFDINDFDETLPGPWEWDLKRLAASFVIAGRHNGFADKACWRAARRVVRAYRRRMGAFAAMPALEVWYARIDAEAVLQRVHQAARRGLRQKRLIEVKGRLVPQDDFPKLADVKAGRPVIRDNPPLIFHLTHERGRAFQQRFRAALARYRESLAEDRRQLLDRYRLLDLAMKVVGVGSVGTRCAIALFMASEKDALFLQVKEAQASVLEPFAGPSAFASPAQRVVVGQRLMQSASDIFLGWTEAEGGHFYLRQLRDMRVKPRVELFDPRTMEDYAMLCGWSLARAHAKSGDAARICGYLGRSEAFDEAVADFAAAYADQNGRDHAALEAAIKAGRVRAEIEE
jgi:uncharacterized protein (DUF2252 family)